MGITSIKKYLMTFLSVLVLQTACDKGLAPPENVPRVIDFPITPEGGNPAGSWIPDETNPVSLVIMDPTAIPFIVDSLNIDTALEGFFRFEISSICSVYAVLTLVPSAYVLGSTQPITVVINDTLSGTGTFEINDDRALALPLETQIFNLDTLGFTASANHMDLITLPNLFNYMDIVEIPVYFVFHLIRAPDQMRWTRLVHKKAEKNR